MLARSGNAVIGGPDHHRAGGEALGDPRPDPGGRGHRLPVFGASPGQIRELRIDLGHIGEDQGAGGRGGFDGHSQRHSSAVSAPTNSAPR